MSSTVFQKVSEPRYKPLSIWEIYLNKSLSSMENNEKNERKKLNLRCPVPDHWKEGSAVPLKKVPDPKDKAETRLIEITHYLSLQMEKIVL